MGVKKVWDKLVGTVGGVNEDDEFEIVPVGQLLPEEIDIPAPVVDMVYERQGEKRFICPMWKKARVRAEAKARERQERG